MKNKIPDLYQGLYTIVPQWNGVNDYYPEQS